MLQFNTGIVRMIRNKTLVKLGSFVAFNALFRSCTLFAPTTTTLWIYTQIVNGYEHLPKDSKWFQTCLVQLMNAKHVINKVQVAKIFSYFPFKESQIIKRCLTQVVFIKNNLLH